MQNIEAEVLVALYRGARESRPPSQKELLLRLRTDARSLSEALHALDRLGLATARTARLTFPGLAVAAQLASTARAVRVDRRKRRSLAA
jgi:hypothetical protein